MENNTRNYIADSYAKLVAMVENVSAENNIWAALAEMWNEHPDFKDRDVFYDAVHTVMWGFVPEKNYDPEYQELIWAVADVMENCDEALESWHDLSNFVYAYGYVAATIDPDVDNDVIYRHSIIHYRYLRDRMMCKLEFEREFCTEPNKEASEFWRAYEAVIVGLIPAAAKWTRAQWGNENSIHDTLLALYGVDYRDRFEEFDRVILMKMGLDGTGAIDAESAWYAMNILKLPYTFAEALWPNNTKEVVRQLFVKAVECTLDYERRGKPDFTKKDSFIHATHIFDRKDLLESWIYKICLRWNNKKVFGNSKGYELKKNLFDLSMG